MKYLQINKKACNKLVAVILVTTLTFTQIANGVTIAHANALPRNAIVNEISGNYKYSIDGKTIQ